LAQDRNPLAQIPIARKSLKAAASRPRRSSCHLNLYELAQNRNPLAQIPLARRSLKAAASRPRRSSCHLNLYAALRCPDW